MTLAEIARVVRGTVHGDPSELVTGHAYCDSRDPVNGGLFVAIVGERSDGHRHAAAAHAVLGSRPIDRPTVVVADPVLALGRLARHVRARVGPTVLAVTGSHGKTTTKELLGALVPGAVVSTGNQNNELGVPLTMLRLRHGDRHLVLEMGSRGLGHLSYLCDIARPDIAAVLNVGSAHVGAMGSTALIARAKAELVAGLSGDGVAVLNADDPWVATMSTPGRVRTFGRTGEVSWRRVVIDAVGRPTFELGQDGTWLPVKLRLTGPHHVANAAATAAMALAVGVPLDEIAWGLTAARPASPSRMQVHRRHDGLLLLDDAYNSNPHAVHAALSTLVSVGSHRSGRTVAVLGPMHELGPAARDAHVEVGRAARAAGVDLLLAVGDAAGWLGGTTMPDRTTALQWLQHHLRADDTVLIKASHAERLDLLVPELLSHHPVDEPGQQSRRSQGADVPAYTGSSEA